MELSENSSLMPKLVPVDRNSQETQKTARIDDTSILFQLEKEIPKSFYIDNKQIYDINQEQPLYISKLQNHKKFKSDKHKKRRRKKRGRHNKQFKKKKSVYEEGDYNNKAYHQDKKKQHKKIEPLGMSIFAHII